MGEISNAQMDDLLATFTELDNAAQRILTALPWQMSAAADRIQEQRIASRETVQRIFREVSAARSPAHD